MVDVSVKKLALSPRDLLIRGAISGALLGAATGLAFSATVSTGQSLAGAMAFPVGFVMIVLLGLELVTGNFGLRWRRWTAKRSGAPSLRAGTGCFSAICSAPWALAACSRSRSRIRAPRRRALAVRIVTAAEIKTVANEALGNAGMLTVFIDGILCNWLVCLGVVMTMMTSSTIGKIVAAWLPIVTFVALGFEHSVVNMFVIPTGMMLGAKVSLLEWWMWNQIPVTLGNVVGGFIFTGLALYVTYKLPEKIRRRHCRS